MFVLDSHCDTPSQIHRLRDVGIWNPHGHVDFPKMKKGGVDGAFFALYVPPSLKGAEATSYALELLADTYDAIEKNKSQAVLATSAQEAYDAKARGLTSVFLGLENGSAIQESLPLLRMFYRMGVRYMTLAHSAHNRICDSSSPEKPLWGGLSPFGKEVVKEMNRLGMLIDVSHISDAAFYDVLDLSSKPVAATHSCCRALAGHRRNMSDDMIRALAAKGGVIQINFYPVFLDDGFAESLAASGIESECDAVEAEFIKDPGNPAKRAAWYAVEDKLASMTRPTYKRIADHIDHAVSVAGIEHVGLGSDFDGISVTPAGMDDISCFGLLFEELRARGYGEGDIARIAGGNFLEILRLQSAPEGR